MAKKAPAAKAAAPAAKTRKASTKADKKAPVKLTIADSLAENMSVTQANVKATRLDFGSLSSIQKGKLKLKHLLLQFLFDGRVIMSRSCIELLGQTGLGKTSLGFLIAAELMNDDGAGLYIETEDKTMDEAHIKRCMNEDLTVAEDLFSRFGAKQAFVLAEVEHAVSDAVRVIRGKLGKRGKMISDTAQVVALVDSLSKIMSASEANGKYDQYGKFMEKDLAKKKKSSSSSNPQDFAKEVAAWCRSLPALMKSNNMTMIFISHQMTKIDMASKGGGANLPEHWKEARNKTKRGGRSVDQNLSYQFIMTEQPGMAYDDNERVIGKRIAIRTNKNSYGTENRSIIFTLKNVDMEEPIVNGKQPRPVLLDEALADFLVQNEICGCTAEAGKYSCDSIGVKNVSAKELCAVIHGNEAHVELFGAKMGIKGYRIDDTIAKSIGQASKELIESEIEIEGDDMPDADGEAAP